jgi:predicted nucleic acid-binding protein
MPELITLDSSVIVAALREQETYHSVCRDLLEKVKEGLFIAVEPYTVFIEVGAAIRRRTGSQRLSARVTSDLRSMDTFFFVILGELASLADSWPGSSSVQQYRLGEGSRGTLYHEA